MEHAHPGEAAANDHLVEVSHIGPPSSTAPGGPAHGNENRAPAPTPISPAIARHLLRRFRQPSPPEPAPDAPDLTDRERDVLGLLVKGFTFPEIGGLLGISAHTVTTHVRHIYAKLEVRSRAEAVYEAMQLGLVGEKP